ncbi:hypothetical protein BG844_12770 [Couchioplanes caeruleus subsp. caeruleus]|uniref:Histidine kinase/HSP90-like ATPase domain-containing protein n=1 Tax=Couchioplanes caeruleus subsp. caeruleus TaxID=56427 RepID=A0A1K0GWU6_9ACTN|nr:hypothetical protein BG844_12770 [Couchioplanes caeruleus subsp. caeruleus]
MLTCSFDATSVTSLRRAVERCARAAGLDDLAVFVFCLAVHEAVINAVCHGGGRGKVHLWQHADRLSCQISDQGPGIATNLRHPPCPEPDSSNGRGLWLIRRVCHDVTITCDSAGTRILLHFPLHPPSQPGANTPVTPSAA